jgi:hypothetical protein
MQIWRRVKLLNRQLIAPNKRVSFKLNRDIYNYKMYIAMAGVFSLFVLPNHSKAEAPKEEGGGARNKLGISNQSVSESDLCMRSDAAFKALAEITIKGLHGPKGRFLSDGEQQDCMAKERQKYENLVESVRSNGVPDDYDEEIDINAIAVDEYLQLSTYVNFIKMDIQGFEMSAVKGMTKTLQSPNLKMLSEFWPYGMRKAGTSVLDYFYVLKQYNFYIYLIENNQLIELAEEKVKTFLDLPESTYMNIFASKARV